MELKIMNRKIRIAPLLIVLFVILSLYVLSMVGLFFWGLITSLKDDVYYGLPTQWMFINYLEVFVQFTMPAGIEKVYFETILGNSLAYALGCAFFKTLVPCIAAYACARFNTKLSKIVHSVVLITMIVPIVGSLPSEIRVAYSVGFYNHIWGLWIMSANMLGLYFFVMYSAFKAMPMGYSEAAKIDGANNLQVLLQIALPLVKNLFFTILLIHFVEFWNNYQTPMVYLPNYPTLGYSLFYMTFGSNEMKEPVKQIALTLTVATPVLVLFICFQERLMGNLTLGGLKG